MKIKQKLFIVSVLMFLSYLLFGLGLCGVTQTAGTKVIYLEDRVQYIKHGGEFLYLSHSMWQIFTIVHIVLFIFFLIYVSAIMYRIDNLEEINEKD